MKKLAKTFLKALPDLSRPRLTALAVGAGIFLVLASNGAAATCTVPSGFFATIQSAIDNVLCKTINVLPGTYTEQLVIDRDLKLKGAGPGLTVIQAPSPLLAVGPANMKSIVRVTGATTDVTIDNFTITGPGDGGCNSINVGIKVEGGAHATITRNHIAEIRDEPFSGCQNGQGIWVGRKFGVPLPENTTGTATIQDNLIDNYQKGGIVVDNTGSSATIGNNVITGVGPTDKIAQNGIQVSRGATGQVTNNEVSGNIYTPQTDASSGILLFEAGNGLDIIRNRVDSNDVGIWVIGTNNTTVDKNRVINSTFDGIALDNQAGVSTDFNVVRRNQSTGNGTGIGLYSANSNLVERNNIRGNTGSGIVASSDSSSNVITDNLSTKNGDFGIDDESSGGGTGGTANTYVDNKCSKNASGDSDPAGLCD